MEVSLNTTRIKLINIIEHVFLPPKDVESGKLFYTTIEIFERLQSIYPTEEYTPTDVCEVLIYLNYETFNGDANKIFWFMQAR